MITTLIISPYSENASSSSFSDIEYGRRPEIKERWTKEGKYQ